MAAPFRIGSGLGSVVAAACAARRNRPAQSQSVEESHVPPLAPGVSRLIFLGTGNSTGTPRPLPLMDPGVRSLGSQVSRRAAQGLPEQNKNYRCSPSILVQYNASGTPHNIQFDCSKHYRESLLRWYPRFGVTGVNAVVLSHDHADAILGLDDLRAVQRFVKDFAEPVPIFVGVRHVDRVQAVFPYLLRNPLPSPRHVLGPGIFAPRDGITVPRFVAAVDWIRVEDFQRFSAGGLEVQAVPLWHGSDYLCQGFLFGTEQSVAYFSDVSEVPDSTMEAVQARGQLSLLIVDALFESTPHVSHFSLADAVNLARKLRPKRVLVVGMSDHMDHEETNLKLRKLQEEGLDVQLAYDGQFVDLRL